MIGLPLRDLSTIFASFFSFSALFSASSSSSATRLNSSTVSSRSVGVASLAEECWTLTEVEASAGLKVATLPGRKEKRTDFLVDDVGVCFSAAFKVSGVVPFSVFKIGLEGGVEGRLMSACITLELLAGSSSSSCWTSS